MFGSRIFGKKEVITEILGHSAFQERENSLARILAKLFGQLYIKLLGWPVSEPRLYHYRLVKLLQPSPTDSILDVGCGPGVHSLEIAYKYGTTITGIDIDDRDVRFATKVKEANNIDNCRFIQSSATDLGFEPESFDKVVCMAVLEHIEDDNLAVQNMARVLREGGVLVGAVPDNKRSMFKPDSFQKSDDPEGHGHVREGYSPEEIADLMIRNGLQLDSYEYVSGSIQNLMLIIEEKTNRYLAFPFTYPVAYVASRFSRKGAGILFKAVKQSNNQNTGVKSTV